MQLFQWNPLPKHGVMTLALALFALVPTARCDEKGKKTASPPGPVSFYGQVLPILQRKCQGLPSAGES